MLRGDITQKKEKRAMCRTKEKKTVFYTDELNDDFAVTRNQKAKKITGKYDYLKDGRPVWKFFRTFLYRVIATPVAFIYMLFKGIKIKNRKALKKIKGGYFLYGNHTQGAGDAFTPSLLTFPKRANILVSPQAVSIPVVGTLVPLVCGLPVPFDIAATKHLHKAMQKLLNKKQVMVIYPEAHVWPYYNGIRNFSAASFAYPFTFGVPAVGFAVTYRQRKIFKNAKPFVTVTVSEPIYPEDCENKREMRDKIYEFMTATAEREKSFAYIEYVKKEKEE